MSDKFMIGGVEIAPASKKVVRLKVTQDLDGGEIAVYVHVIRGSKPGPTLGLFGVQHGDEWIDIEIMRPFVAQLDPQRMAGNLLVVPVCNPIALGTGQRNTQPESDAPDLNRIWPGTHTWISDLLAKVVAEQVVKHCDALLDFHLGPFGGAFSVVVTGNDFPNAEVVKKCRELGIAFGHRCLGTTKMIGVFPGPRSITSYASAILGIPTAVVEIGGSGFGVELERRWIGENHRGIRNVMRHMGILSEALEKPDRILVFTKSTRINPSVGGILVPEREPDEPLREVKKGELLGRVISPYTFEELERLESPCDGFLYYVSRTYPVRPGIWGFGVMDVKDTEWVKP